MRNSKKMWRYLVLGMVPFYAALIDVALLGGCVGMNPVKTALSAKDPQQKAELTAFAVYGSWVAVHAEAEVVVLNPDTPRRIQLAIKDVNRKAKPVSDAAKAAFDNYTRTVAALEAAKSNPDKNQAAIDLAQVALDAAKAAFQKQVATQTPPVAEMRAALH